MRKITMFKQISTIFIALLFLNSCGSQKDLLVPQKRVLPSWYENSPRSSSTDLYALGNGRDKKSAITDALTQMVSTLSVSVSSKFTAKTISQEGKRSTSSAVYTNEIESEVKTIRISNYEVIESKQLGFKKYAVLVTSNNKKLFLSMKKELEQEFSVINKKLLNAQKQNAISEMLVYKKIKKELVLVPNRLLIMSELNPSFNGDKYLTQFNSINAKYEKIVSKISFFINSDKNSQNLKAPIAKGISAKKFKIARGKTREYFNITIVSSIEKANAYGFALARSAIAITVKDYQNNIIGSNKINITGQSTQGYKIAKENVAQKLGKRIDNEGISKILGLEF